MRTRLLQAARDDTVVHTLNNVFGKILGSAELALAQAPLPVVRAELEVIADAVESAAALVRQLPAVPTAAGGSRSPRGSCSESASLIQAFLNAMDGVTYLVDEAGVLLATGHAWSGCSHSDGAAQGAACGFVAGDCLFDGIAGDEVESVYRRVHHAVLAGERPYVAFDYRCDSPDVRRTLRMSVHPMRLPDGPVALLYQSQILSEVTRPWMSLFEPHRIVAQIMADGGLPIARMCSFCQRVEWPLVAQGEPVNWVEADEYYRTGGPEDVRTSHGVCERCELICEDELFESRAPGGGMSAIAQPAL